MAATINASTSPAGIVQTADGTGILSLQTAGTTAVTINASQNVGIGTASPTVKLDVNGTGAKLTNNASADVTVTIGPDTATASRSARLGFLASNTYKNWYVASSWNTSGGLEFTQTTATGGTTISSTPSMMIDSSGNVGIGTASPTTKLNVTGAAATETVIKISGSTTAGSFLHTSNTGGNFYIGKDNSAGTAFGSAYCSGLYSDGAYPMIFWTNSTERMRIDSSGVLLVNTTSYNASVSSSGKFQVQNSAAEWCGAFQNNNAGTAYGLYVRYYNAAPNSTGSEFLYCQDSSGAKASIRSNGGLANYSANNSNLSDQREKTNIELAGSYLDKVCAIPVKTFNYIDQNMEEDGGLTLGVIAQDVQAVAPELIMESNWAGKDEPEKLRLSIYQTDLQYALMKCIQEQQALITSLTARITALEGA